MYLMSHGTSDFNQQSLILELIWLHIQFFPLLILKLGKFSKFDQENQLK